MSCDIGERFEGFIQDQYRKVVWDNLLNLINILLCNKHIKGLDIRQCLYNSFPKDQDYKYSKVII